MAPLDDDVGIDVPCQVEKEVSRREVLREHLIEILLGDLQLDERRALFKRGCDTFAIVLEIDDCDLLWRKKMFSQKWQYTL